MKKTLIKIVELYGVIAICSIISLLFIVLELVNQFFKLSFYELIFNSIEKTLSKNEGLLSTIAAIFIGIYFTVYTLLGSIKIESTFASIRKTNFIKFVKYIKWAFGGAFVYLFYSIFGFIISYLFPSLSKYVLLFSLILLLYMLLSALRLGLAVYLIYEQDLKNIHDLIERDKKERNNQQLLMNRLDKFLLNFERDEEIKRAQEMKEKIESRNSKK